MTDEISRRDFLRLAGLVPLSLAVPRWTPRLPVPAASQNVIVLVFDALSACNLALHGYQRETMPNLTRLADRAIVYHNHYATGDFTTSGTASLLTGTLPWTNRALEGAGRVADSLVHENIFEAFRGHYRFAYTHNPWAQILLEQFQGEIDELVPPQQLFLTSYDKSTHGFFTNDEDTASVAWTRFLKLVDGTSYSLFLSHIYEPLHEKQLESYAAEFPLGIPMTSDKEAFLLEDAVQWLGARLQTVPQPFLAYVHFLPPHAPYRTSREFYDRFAHDGLKPIDKPLDVFADPGPVRDLRPDRRAYDEYLLYADKALGAFWGQLEAAGLVDKTWVVFTSDHGEMFERGIEGHGGPALYDPAIRVPLLIFEPGRTQREDVRAATSAIDLLPTLAHVTGQTIPSWVEGSILPPFSPPSPDRRLYAIQARDNDPRAALTNASVVMLSGQHKLHYYFGYKGRGVQDFTRLFDLAADPEELDDLSARQPQTYARLFDELKSKLAEVDRPYLKGR